MTKTADLSVPTPTLEPGDWSSRDNSYLILHWLKEERRILEIDSRANEYDDANYAGAYQSFNLDGGGSSTLVIDGKLISARPDREPQQRRVANSILIISN